MCRSVHIQCLHWKLKKDYFYWSNMFLVYLYLVPSSWSTWFVFFIHHCQTEYSKTWFYLFLVPPLSCSRVLRMCWTRWLGGAHRASSSWVCRASPCWWETSSPRLLVSSTLTPLRYCCCCQSASTLLTEAHSFMLLFCPFMLTSGSTDRGSDRSRFAGVLP